MRELMLELHIPSERELNRRITQQELLEWVAFFEERERRHETARKQAQTDAEKNAKRAGLMGRRA